MIGGSFEHSRGRKGRSEMAPKVEDKQKVEDKVEDKPASPLKLGLLILGWCVPRVIV